MHSRSDCSIRPRERRGIHAIALTHRTVGVFTISPRAHVERGTRSSSLQRGAMDGICGSVTGRHYTARSREPAHCCDCDDGSGQMASAWHTSSRSPHPATINLHASTRSLYLQQSVRGPLVWLDIELRTVYAPARRKLHSYCDCFQRHLLPQ